MCANLAAASQRFARLFAELSPTVVLARVFCVVPYRLLPLHDREFALRMANQFDAQLQPSTPVLSLLGTHGHLPRWCDRELSKGHLAIPLLSTRFVQGIPMLAQLLADIDVDLSALDEARPIASRRLQGSSSQCFYVAEAADARDAQGRHVIAAQDFVKEFNIKTVFGMAGTYADGTLIASIIFTAEQLDRLTVDRFPSLMTSVRLATSGQALNGAIYPAESP